MHAGPPFRSASTATPPTPLALTAPCTPVNVRPGTHVTRAAPPPLPLPAPHTPGAASRAPLRASPLLLRARVHALAAPAQSRPTRCDSRAPSPAGPTVPNTPTLPRAASAPDLQYGTTARHGARSPHPARTAPLSAPLCSSNHAPTLRRRCTTRQLLPPALRRRSRPT